MADNTAPQSDLEAYQEYQAAQSYQATEEARNTVPAEQPDRFDNSAMRSYVQTNLKSQQKPAEGFLESLEAGFGMSVSGLGISGKMPSVVLPEHASRAMRIASQLGQLAGDFPFMVLGGAIGGAEGLVGGGTVGSVVPGAGTLVGGVGLGAVGASAGAFALPAAMRKLLVDHYEKGDIKTAGEFVDRLLSTSWEAIKGGITGGATALTGGVVTPVAGKILGLGGELAAMSTVGAALEARLPSADDFIDGAVVLGGLHAVGTVAPKLRSIFVKTGEQPADVLDAAMRDVILKQQLLSEDPTAPEQAGSTQIEASSQGTVEEGEKPAPLVPRLVADESGVAGIPDPKEPATPIERSPEEQQILSKIGTSADKTEPTLKEKFDDFYAKNIDYLDPILSAEKEAQAHGAEISAKDSAYQSGRRFAAYMDKVRGFFEFGTRDAITGKVNGEGLNAIYRDIPDGDLDGYRAYAMAQRALELVARPVEDGKKPIVPWSNFDEEGARKVVKAGAAKFEDINQRRIKFENRVIDYAYGKGLLSEEQVARIKEANKQYFPLNRVQDADIFTGKVSGSSMLKKIFGSSKDVLDPILQTYKNTEMLIRRADANDIRGMFLDNMRKGNLVAEAGAEVKPEDAFLSKVPTQMIPKVVYADELTRALAKQGFKFEGDDITIFRPEQTYLKDNQIAIYENGEKNIYEGSPGVIDSLKRLEGDRTAIDVWSKTMGFFATATRVGTVANPAFAFRHFFRSQIMAAVYSKTGMWPFLDSAAAMKDFMGKSQAYQDWLYNGGAVSSWMKIDDHFLSDNAIEVDKEAPTHGRAWNAVHTAMDAAESFIKLTDNLSRFAEYKRSVAQGVTPEEAAYRSRQVVPDYQMVGAQRTILRTGVAFIGAHINSLDRMGREMKEDLPGMISKLSVITALSAMVYAVNKDDPAIDELPSWQKNTYWNLNLSRMIPGGGGDPDDPSKAYILRLPKPWAPGILFGSGAEVALDAFFKEHPNEFKDFAYNLFHSVLPEPMPNIAQPILDQYSNKQFFTGRPLVSADKEKLLPEMMYSPYTSETAKQLAKIIGYVPLVRDIGPSNAPLASPAVVENYIRTWTGTLGGWALKIADTGLNGAKRAAIELSPSMSEGEKASALRQLNNDKAEPWSNTPFISEFISRYPSFSAQSIQDFYVAKDKTDRVYNSVRMAAKNGDFESAVRIMQAYPDLDVRLDGMEKSISTMKATYERVQDNPDIAPIEKRQLLDTILFSVGSVAKMGNQLMIDFSRNVGKNR